MPPPPELDAGKEQVSFFQRAWSDLDPAVGGKVFQLDMADRTIRPLRIDPQENKVNEVRTGDVPVDYRYHIEPDSHRLLVGFPRLER